MSNFVTSWTVALQTSLSFPIFRSLLEFMFIESVMASNHLTKKIEFPVNLNPDLAQG